MANLTHRRPHAAASPSPVDDAKKPFDLQLPAGAREDEEDKFESLPTFEIPNFTVKDLLSAIPKHCYNRSTFHSSLYVVMDFAFIAALAYLASFIDPFFASLRADALLDRLPLDASHPARPWADRAAPALLWAAKWAAWNVYWFWQGMVGTGVWVIAHECGHQAYSSSKTINNAVGWALHSLLLVPYHSWRISHAQHHAATGHITRDQVFVPRTRGDLGLDHVPGKPKGDNGHAQPETVGSALQEAVEDAPIYTLLNILLQQIFGWPLYLLTNASGQRSYPKGTNHFDPKSVIFESRHRGQIIFSDVGLAIVLGALITWARCSPGGFVEVIKYYGVPYLWVNNWLVMITFLQHTDPMLPHYRAGLWTFPRGALATIDRTFFGPISAFFWHGICETHVAHHVASKIPHYHAWEATEALKGVLGQHYHCSRENFVQAMWNVFSNCKFIEDEGDIVFFKNMKGQQFRRVAPPASAEASDSGVALSE